MPEVKFKHVVSFSSEEKPHKAENLLGDDTTKKWKCAPGDKQASVVLQLEKSTNISSIDIGNDGSAFVEVLVGRSSHENIKYQVLLVASSFMSPQESRVGTSPTRVRIFTQDKLSPDAATEKWDIVKIVCTQPFNKRASYGLTFVKLHSTSEKADDSYEKESSSNEKTTRQFGSFKLKKDDSDSKGSSFHPGQQMLMAKKGETSNVSIKKETMRRSRSPDSPRVEEKRRKMEPKKSKPADSKITKTTATPVNFDQLKRKNANSKKTSNNAVPVTQPAKRVASKAITKKRRKVAKPFDQILSGVNFVISGFQNPLRSDIREKALRMGAQYRRDWTPDSTHLICAFPNTPKFRQVQGVRGRIVKKDWIEDCESMRRPISWRNYSMNSDVSSSSEEEEEEEEKDTEEYKPTTESLRQESDDPYEDSTDEGGDTEDEIEKLQIKKAHVKNVSSAKNDNAYDASTDDEDPYGASTDEEDSAKGNEKNEHGLPSLPDYFEHKHFLLYGDFDQSVRRLLTRHIVAYGGKISKYMDDDVEYVISEQEWDEEFDRALSSNAALVFVKPTWVFSCGAQQRLLSTQPFLISHS